MQSHDYVAKVKLLFVWTLKGYREVLFLHCALALLARAAPRPACSEFHSTVNAGMTMVKRVLLSIPDVHKSCITSKELTLGSPTKDLQYLQSELMIPTSPSFKSLSTEFTMELSLDHMYQGLQLYQDLLSTVRHRLPNPDKLTELLAVINDLLAQVLKIRELAQLETVTQYQGSGLSARLNSDFQAEIATHITLEQLTSFSQHVVRSLRKISHSKLAVWC
ncbi:hypothetical protein SKAU_G00298110 [Synaphobranchus kaupii]|uniref:Uncharacterized protein n=1 Tax=Synaphobranchus kaupii TaxID=118154 RepID=A0A9Q1EV48_SYNKA|nr:hypothetical protein SKAU_G00298110 [Synaphobranchus kaupii]